jgi:murein DD-endopeptidase MepM/ murein hydrolase activator NlpD
MGGEITRIMKKNIKNINTYIGLKTNSLIYLIFKRLLKPFSKYSRKFFEKVKIQKIVSGIVVASLFSVVVLPSSITQAQSEFEKNYANLNEVQIEITTENSVRLPLDKFTISQGYTFFHKGIDFAAPTGEEIFPIMDGVVEKTAYDRFAFGNHVVVNHGSGIITLYAHLSKISVKEGQNITKNETIGTVGSTGWSTGSHLHLQVWDEEGLVNPKVFFEDYFDQKLANKK